MLHAIQRAFFSGQKSCAMINRKKFNLIRLTSIALVCTSVRDLPFSSQVSNLLTSYPAQIEHCLREWESGSQIQVSLDETVDTPRYRTHLANATTWKHLNEDKTTQILEHLSNRL